MESVHSSSYHDEMSARSELITSEGEILHARIDIQGMLQDILKYGEIYDFGYEGAVNHLLGFLSGISADDELCDAEIRRLDLLLSRDSDLVSKRPESAIKMRLDVILADGLVDEMSAEICWV